MTNNLNRGPRLLRARAHACTKFNEMTINLKSELCFFFFECVSPPNISKLNRVSHMISNDLHAPKKKNLFV